MSNDARPARREDTLAQTTVFLFSVALGMTTVIVPLVASAAGYDLGIIGVLVGVSAISQIVVRLGMGSLMDRFSTRSFILVSLVLLATSCAILGITADLWVFIVSQLLQGAARAYFFTGAQTHVVRGARPAVSAISLMNVTNGVGLLIGPLVAGFIGDVSLTVALFVAAAIAGLAVPACIFLIRYEPFAKPRLDPGARRIPMWRRPGVITAGWMGATAGGWRGIMNSYLPILLTEAGFSIPAIGAMVMLANLAALGGSAIAWPVRKLGERLSAVLSTVLTAGGIASAAMLTGSATLVGVALFISGVGAGILQTLGPALAAQAVGAEERGRSIASVGTFRAISLLVTPMGIGALIFLLPSAGLATAIVAVATGIPLMLTRGKSSREGT